MASGAGGSTIAAIAASCLVRARARVRDRVMVRVRVRVRVRVGWRELPFEGGLRALRRVQARLELRALGARRLGRLRRRLRLLRELAAWPAGRRRLGDRGLVRAPPVAEAARVARVEAVREEDAAAVGAAAVKERLAADGALATAVELGEQLERSFDQREETRLAWAGLGRGVRVGIRLGAGAKARVGAKGVGRRGRLGSGRGGVAGHGQGQRRRYGW